MPMIRRDTHSPSLAARVSNGGGATVKPRMPLPARSEAAPAAMLAALLVLGACLLGGLPAEAVPAASCSASDHWPWSILSSARCTRQMPG